MIDLLNKKVRAQSLVDAVTERLEEAIISGAVEPGSRLSEQALAKSLGVSRAPLREAIRRLEGRKLLERTPNVGVRVATVSAEDVGEILHVHVALQGMACGLAAQHITDDEIAALKEMTVQQEKLCKTPSGKARDKQPKDFDLDLEFHFRIATASRNRRMTELLFDDLSYLIWSNRFISSARSSRWSKGIQEHKGIIAALARHDTEAAEQRMRQHILNDWAFMKEQIQAAGTEDGRVEPKDKDAAEAQARGSVEQLNSFRVSRGIAGRDS